MRAIFVFIASSVCLWVCGGNLNALSQDLPQPSALHSTVIQLRPNAWQFNTAPAPRSTLTSGEPAADFAPPSDPHSGFTVTLRANLGASEETLLEIPGVLSVRSREDRSGDRKRQNYPAYKMADGSVPVLEASLALSSPEHPAWTNMTLGVPLAILPRPEGEHEIALSFTGVDWKLYIDGQMLDNDFPFGYPPWPVRTRWKIQANKVTTAALYFPALSTTNDIRPITSPSAIQYWTPPGHNNWVGDVETFFYHGRYHVFYLYDRRHHQSKFGAGAHYFEHLSTTDFLTWTEHEAATPLQEQWECIGTGVPFVDHDQLCLSYGLHTTRVYPREKTTLPLQWKYLEQHGSSGRFPRATTPGIPAGATYAVCTDGVANFRKTEVMFHPCENPSVFHDPSGKLRLMANYGSKGIWESDSVEGGWHCVSPDFPPGGDCTIYFRWGKFDYIMGGFTGLWSKPAESPANQYENVVQKGLDFYDGCNVPSITQISGGRWLMAGWIPIRGWGGPLILRELIQAENGRIYSKWMNEVTPRAEPAQLLAANLAQPATFSTPAPSFQLAFKARSAAPKTGRLALTFLPENGDAGSCEFAIDLALGRAQFAPGSLQHFAPAQKSLREGAAPHHAGDFAIEHFEPPEPTFPVRLLIKNDPKLGGSIIDAEIDGRRTIITFRDELSVSRLFFRPENLEIEDLELSPASPPPGKKSSALH